MIDENARIFRQVGSKSSSVRVLHLNTVHSQANHHATPNLDSRMTPQPTPCTLMITISAYTSIFKHIDNHFFFPLALAFDPVPLDDTLTALDVCPELALLPFLTTSSCLFCRVNMSV